MQLRRMDENLLKRMKKGEVTGRKKSIYWRRVSEILSFPSSIVSQYLSKKFKNYQFCHFGRNISF